MAPVEVGARVVSPATQRRKFLSTSFSVLLPLRRAQHDTAGMRVPVFSLKRMVVEFQPTPPHAHTELTASSLTLCPAEKRFGGPRCNGLIKRAPALIFRRAPRSIDSRQPHTEKEKDMPLDRITCDPNRLNGQPCIRNLRLTVRRVLEAMAICPDREDLRREYPELEDEDLRQALEYAAACLDDKTLRMPAHA